MKKFVFLTSNINEPRVPNRIAEFKARGYEMEVFCYCRDPERPFRKEEGVEYHILGNVGRGSSSYFKRLFAEYKDVRKVLAGLKGQDVVYYLINNDMALLYHLLGGRRPYIYEEADLRHTYFSSRLLRSAFESLDKKIIRKSMLTVFLSMGFSRFHYGDKVIPSNVSYIFNKLNPGVKDYPYQKTRKPDMEHLRIAFVGSIRQHDSIYNFARVVCSCFPDYEFHFYGNVVDDKFNELSSFANCIFHGAFSNPADLPGIYSGIDLLLSTYDAKYDNVKYAEPNKIYESIYFETPVIVSKGTYLSQRVEEMGIGYSVDALDDDDIKDLVSSLTLEGITERIANARLIPKKECILDNDEFFSKLEDSLKVL